MAGREDATRPERCPPWLTLQPKSRGSFFRRQAGASVCGSCRVRGRVALGTSTAALEGRLRKNRGAGVLSSLARSLSLNRASQVDHSKDTRLSSLYHCPAVANRISPRRVRLTQPSGPTGRAVDLTAQVHPRRIFQTAIERGNLLAAVPRPSQLGRPPSSVPWNSAAAPKSEVRVRRPRSHMPHGPRAPLTTGPGNGLSQRGRPPFLFLSDMPTGKTRTNGTLNGGCAVLALPEGGRGDPHGGEREVPRGQARPPVSIFAHASAGDVRTPGREYSARAASVQVGVCPGHRGQVGKTSAAGEAMPRGRRPAPGLCIFAHFGRVR